MTDKLEDKKILMYDEYSRKDLYCFPEPDLKHSIQRLFDFINGKEEYNGDAIRIDVLRAEIKNIFGESLCSADIKPCKDTLKTIGESRKSGVPLVDKTADDAHSGGEGNLSSDDILNIPIKDRTEKQHLALVKHFGGVRQYLLSMGDFKDVDIDEPQQQSEEKK